MVGAARVWRGGWGWRRGCGGFRVDVQAQGHAEDEVVAFAWESWRRVVDSYESRSGVVAVRLPVSQMCD